MTEVKRGNGIPTIPLRKPTSFHHTSSSYKHIYDDVFASPIQSRQQSPSFIEDDYAEMFGSSRTKNGTWSISYASIPVLDLPPPSEMRVRGASGVRTVQGERRGEVEYSGVFGGFGDGNFGLPDGEELFGQFVKKNKMPLNVIPRNKVQTKETSTQEILTHSEKARSSAKAFTHSSDSLPNFERHRNEFAMKKSGEITKPSHAHDLPTTSPIKMEEMVGVETALPRKRPVIKDGAQLDKDVNRAKKQGRHDRHTSVDLDANVKNNYSGFPTESEFSASNSVDTALRTSQPAKESIHSFSQPLDNTNHFDHLNEICNTLTDEAICSADVNNSNVHKVGPTPNLSSETTVLNNTTETNNEATNTEKQEKEAIQNASMMKEPILLDVPKDASQPVEGGNSKTVDDDFAINFYGSRKKGRHSRITSLDLKNRTPSLEKDGQLQRKPRFGGSYSFDASHDPQTAHVKVHPSMMAPSSSVPQFFPVESRYKISENSTWRNFGADVYNRSAESSPPSFEEQLDMNSDAGLSVAALQKAIEEASMIIQMAKEYLERECQGSSEMRFKDTLTFKGEQFDQLEDDIEYEIIQLINADKQKLPFYKETLKVKVANDNQVADDINRFQENMIHGICTSVENEKERHSFSERMGVQEEKKFAVSEECIEETKMRDYIPPVDGENERPSISERNSVFENSEASPIVTKNFVHDTGFTEERNSHMPNLIGERDKEEGGREWEAAKHLNQLISGVKNKLASFMTWQSDTDKKEDPRETEASRRSHLLFKESEPDLEDVQKTEIKSEENKKDDIVCPGEHVEMEIGFLSETVEPYENENDSIVASNSNVASVDFMFCPFRNEEVHCSTESDEEVHNESEECMDIEVTSVREEVVNKMKHAQLLGEREEQNESEECMDIEVTSVREEVVNKMKREQLLGKREEQNLEAEDDSCTTMDSLTSVREEMQNEIKYEELSGECREQSREVLDDSFTTLERIEQEINTEETSEIVEEPYVASEDSNKITDEEVSNRSLDKECPEITTEIDDENDDCEDDKVIKKTENSNHDEQILEETNLNVDIGTCARDLSQTDHIEEVADQNHGGNEFKADRDLEIERDSSQTDHIEEVADQNHGGNEFTTDRDLEIERDSSQTDHIEEVADQSHGGNEFTTDQDLEIERDLGQTDHIEVVAELMTEVNEIITDDDVNIEDKVSDKASFIETEKDAFMKTPEVLSEEMPEKASSVPEAEFEQAKTENEHVADDCQQTDNVCLSESEGSCIMDDSSVNVDENPYLDPELKNDETVQFYDSFVELDEIIEDAGVKMTRQFENSVLHSSQSDVYPEKEETVIDKMEGESEDILENQTKHVGEINTITNEEADKCEVESVQRRRRWFDNGVKILPTEQPSILEENLTEMETDQEALDESVPGGSVEVHIDEPDVVANQESVAANPESTPKRRRWSVKIGEEGLPVPPPLFGGNGVKLEESPKNENEPIQNSKSESSLEKLNAESDESVSATVADFAVNEEKYKKSVEATPRRKRWFGNNEDAEIKDQKSDKLPTVDEMEVESSKVEPLNERHLEEVNKKEKEKEKERMVVERAIREARERAFVEAKERARRDASEKPKVSPVAQERVGKMPFEARASTDKASIDAKLRAERAAVERATSEARERALQKSVSEKAFHKSREQAANKKSSTDSSFQSSSSFSRADMSNKGERYDGTDNESAQRRKARLERQSRERTTTALEEKNRRDLSVQNEQAAKNMMADSLDAEVKRWSSGKEGNLRLLLSTLQYILGPESGWQAVSLTDLITATSLRKAYKKANLCVHPDKLQQRGATIHQKYICEKVFELLKDAFSKLGPDER